ncbi:hypothetical protein FE257_006539 [Aspergillus nanangensis]|uniref:Uncharacterized protein n=1 Tax=Aspergillus nanangensis TaxID=2582783 RepID=A0AAD4CY75_ASPNN|nr:hypothetical protein FE257_006539 [Aspergillus nanangensis]QGW49092.1 hypothetical protein FE257_006539 [Aspergillus nanangensis]
MFDLCRHAYNITKSELINILVSRAQKQERSTYPPDKLSSFALVYHYIGRLASHIRAPQQLVNDTGHFIQVLESYKVCAIPYLPCEPRPVPDGQTTLHGILNRMLARGDPERARIEESLLHMDTQSGFLDTYMDQYNRCTPQIHAEVQALEHFYMRKLSFVGNDPYIACSKPACLCCELYFKYHPARMVIPESHRKVWIKWGAPLVTSSKKSDPEYQRQLKVLNGMTAEIRQMAIAQILGQSSSTPWHPDSRTGISHDRWSYFDPGDIVDDTPRHTTVEATLGEQATGTGSQVASRPDQGGANRSDEDSDSDIGGVSVIIGDS